MPKELGGQAEIPGLVSAERKTPAADAQKFRREGDRCSLAFGISIITGG
jgi:hypothetical protein